MLLVLDNYDSFTFNLVQYLGELAADHPLAAEVRVVRNDALSLDGIRALAPEAILISPGPGDPNQAGICLEVLKELGPTCRSSACASAINAWPRCLVAGWCGRRS